MQLERIAEGDYRPLLLVDNFAALIDKLNDEQDGLYEQVASFSLSSDDGDVEGHAASIIKPITK